MGTTRSSTTTTFSAASAAIQTKARESAVLACATYNSRTTSAPSLSEDLNLAAADARTAARLDASWQQLAADMTQYSSLPETSNTSTQEEEGTLDRQRISQTCRSLTSAELPGVIADCTDPPPQSGEPQILPGDITLACADNGVGVQDLRWNSWTATSATASGTLWEKSCNPNCASGTIGYYPAAISLNGVVETAAGQVFSAMTVTYQGKTPNGHRTDDFKIPLPPG